VQVCLSILNRRNSIIPEALRFCFDCYTGKCLFYAARLHNKANQLSLPVIQKSYIWYSPCNHENCFGGLVVKMLNNPFFYINGLTHVNNGSFFILKIIYSRENWANLSKISLASGRRSGGLLCERESQKGLNILFRHHQSVRNFINKSTVAWALFRLWRSVRGTLLGGA